MSFESTLNQINHYQRKLEKYAALRETDKILCCIHKLKYLPVTVSHLEMTGVGKSVNALRHHNGITGEKAKALVNKWKVMVSQEEEMEEKQKASQYTATSRSNSSPYCKQNENEYVPSDDIDRLQINEGTDAETVPQYNPLPKGQNSVEEDNTNGYNPKTSREDYMSVSEVTTPIPYQPTTQSALEKVRDSSPPLHNGDTEHSQAISRSTKDKENIKHLRKKEHKSKHGHSEEHHHNVNVSCSSSKKSKHSPSKEKDTRKDKERDSSKSKHKSHHKDKEKHSSRETNHNSSSNSPDKKRNREDPVEENHSKKKKKVHSHVDKDNANHKGKSFSKKSSSSHKSKSQKEYNLSSKSKSNQSHLESSSEFGEALMGIDSTPVKKKKKSNEKTEKSKEYSPISQNNQHSSPSYSREFLPELPHMLDVVVPTPQLLTDYKPLPHLPQRFSGKEYSHNAISNEEGLNMMLISKNSKQRRIYTGKSSTNSVVFSLFDLCIKILQENIDALEATGGIPFDILKPVLEKATSQQLFNLEDYNPYLLSDTDVLWASHCRKAFKNKQREEMETWRDMYVRCTDEHHEKMRSVTEILQKKYVTKAPPKRMTQLAYVNVAAKPPKSVARAQAKYGTGYSYGPTAARSTKKSDDHSRAGPSSSNASSSNSIVPPPKPDRPFPPNRTHAAKKMKVAPLMGKARQLMKKVCRR